MEREDQARESSDRICRRRLHSKALSSLLNLFSDDLTAAVSKGPWTVSQTHSPGLFSERCDFQMLLHSESALSSRNTEAGC